MTIPFPPSPSLTRVVLCSASAVFRRVFGIDQEGQLKANGLAWSSDWSKKDIQAVSATAVNSGKVRGLKAVRQKQDDPSCTEIVLDESLITEEAFKRCLDFLYTGTFQCSKEDDDTVATATCHAANLLNLPEMVTVVENVKKEEEFLNPSIGTWLNDRSSSVAKKLFLNQELFSDVTFNVEGTLIHAHRVVLTTRCEFMSVMFNSPFVEGSSAEVCVCVRACMCVCDACVMCVCACLCVMRV